MVSTGKGLREEDTRKAPICGQRRAPERRSKGGARGGEEHWLAHSCGQSAEIAGEEMRPLAVRSERKSEENGERWKKEKISTAAAGHRVEENFLCAGDRACDTEKMRLSAVRCPRSVKKKKILSLQWWERMRMATVKG